ncbi:vesicle transport protein USE1 [Phlebotomus argentipes]|uniref:vesicle transport protein USE1 n=1 Tax=Phlebotomus argentipes TaxID=94469 RepID=UPI0028933FD8|nr:vesicle transport protein USE1 [Phlebotomus argentipes]
MSSRSELNLRSLIAHCEEMAKTDSGDWRLKKYIKSIDILIEELEEEDLMRPDNRVIEEYRSRCGELKKLVNYQEPQKIIRKEKDPSQDVHAVFKEIKQVHNANYFKELRKDLLGGESGVRQRVPGSGGTGDDMGKAMKHFADIQEKIAENMISLTSNLKEQTQTANRIIKNDVETVKKSTSLTESNFGSLKTKSEKLKEHSKRACKCWVWMMIGFVMMIFIFMVFFIKVMKK